MESKNKLKVKLKKSLYDFDPDWNLAQNHGRANTTGLPVKLPSHEINHEQICFCCHQHIQKKPASLFDNPKQLEFLGFAFPIFYSFVKFCIILLILSMGTYNLLALQLAIQQNWQLCHSNNVGPVIQICDTVWILLSRISPSYNIVESSIRIISFSIQLLALIYIRNSLTKLQQYYDQRTTSLSDYAIFMNGISRKTGIRQAIQDFLQHELPQTQPHIQSIIPLPSFHHIEQLSHERKKLLNKLRPFFKGNKQIDTQSPIFKSLNQQIVVINKGIIDSAYKAYQEIKLDVFHCQMAIIVFQTQIDKQKVLEEFFQVPIDTIHKYFGNTCHTYVEQASNPEEIIWQHINLPMRKRVTHMAIGWSLSVLLLALVFGAFYLAIGNNSQWMEQNVKIIDENPQDSSAWHNYHVSIGLVYFLMFSVILFDKMLLSKILHKFTDLQLPATTQQLQFSFSIKYAFSLFFTTALMTVAIQALRFNNYFETPYGVIDQQSIMFFMNSFFVPLFWLVNPMRIIKNIKKKLHFGKRNLTQQQAHQLMQQQAYDVGKRFAQILQMMWFVFFYSTLLPLGAIVTTGGLTFYYWVDKYNLLRRSKVVGKVSSAPLQKCLTLLDLTLLFKPLGSLLFDLQIRNGTYVTQDICLICISITYLLLPKKFLINYFNKQEFRPEQKKFHQALPLFHKTYLTQHPLYSVLRGQDVDENKIINKLLELHEIPQEKTIRAKSMLPVIDNCNIKNDTEQQSSQRQIRKSLMH